MPFCYKQINMFSTFFPIHELSNAKSRRKVSWIFEVFFFLQVSVWMYMDMDTYSAYHDYWVIVFLKEVHN